MFHVEYPRIVPERRPPGHQPAAPRFSLRWPEPIGLIVSEYFAIQGKDLDWATQSDFFDRVRASFTFHGPDAWEIMRTAGPDGEVDAILVAYWMDPTAHARWCETSSFLTWFASDDRLTESAGLWRETIRVPYDRHETIYSGPSYPIGLARTPGAQVVPITMNGYFGAARDRMPVSAIDRLESPLDHVPTGPAPESRGRRIRVAAPHNTIVIRSGQFWEGAGNEQRTDYHDNLQPKLRRGMAYLAEHRAETGTLSLRNMVNLNEDGSERSETSTYGHFLSMAHLEDWAKSHETHLDIYRHAIAMNRLHKENREVITWHEVFALIGGPHGEYVNCRPETGLLSLA